MTDGTDTLPVDVDGVTRHCLVSRLGGSHWSQGAAALLRGGYYAGLVAAFDQFVDLGVGVAL